MRYALCVVGGTDIAYLCLIFFLIRQLISIRRSKIPEWSCQHSAISDQLKILYVHKFADGLALIADRAHLKMVVF